jgi:hypothetical protein
MKLAWKWQLDKKLEIFFASDKRYLSIKSLKIGTGERKSLKGQSSEILILFLTYIDRARPA